MADRTAGFGSRLSLLLFLVGIASLVMLVFGFLIPDWRANNQYRQGSCVAVDKRVADSVGEGRITYRPEIKIRYQVDGREYESWAYDAIPTYGPNRAEAQAIADGFQLGATYPCWFDPARPEQVILVRGHAWIPYLLLVVPAVFLALGGGGLSRSWSNRGTTAAQVARKRAVPAAATGRVLGPQRANLLALELPTSSGNTLQYRLAGSNPPRQGLVGCAVITVILNALSAAVLLAMNASRFGWEWARPAVGPPGRGGIVAIVGPLALAIFIYTVALELLIGMSVGPTIVVISRQPLEPGGCCEVFLSQGARRRLAMNALRLICICEQKLTRQEGTRTVTERRRVHEQEVFARQQFELHPGLPFEARAELRLPADALHSLVKADHEVSWKLAVKGEIAGWPNFERDFPIVVESASPPRQ
jgi:hypothetical protein